MKKTLIIALVLIVGFSCCTILVPPLISAEPSGYWTDYAAEAFSAGDGTELDPYQISTPEELAYLATSASSSGFTSGVYFELTADLDMSAHYWRNIPSFEGYFDGNNHTISNLTGASLFRKIGISDINDGYVRNLRLSNVQASVACLAEECSRYKISNIIASGDINGSSDRVAGLIALAVNNGSRSPSIIENCVNFANVTNTNAAGYAGGIVGQLTCSTISSCVNYGTITNYGYFTGGIAGYSVYGSEGKVSISYCANYGDVTNLFERLYDAAYATGITSFDGISSRGTISYCLNSGNISSTSNTAGALVLSSTFFGSITLSNSVSFVTDTRGSLNGRETVSIPAWATNCLDSSETGVTIDDVLETLNAENPENPMWAVSNSVNEGVPHLTALYWEDV